MKGCLDCCWPVILGMSLSNQIPTLQFGFVGDVIFVPQLDLPVCHGDYLLTPSHWYPPQTGLILPSCPACPLSEDRGGKQS
jgi:hypothetical protein